MPDYYNLFLKQSYSDLYDEYIRTLNNPNAKMWDYVVLTASNEQQAENYYDRINERLESGMLDCRTKYLVIPDPDGLRVGSGGATLNVLKQIKEKEGTFEGLKILVIHSGGDSKRVPQYSACGKLFSPVPRELPCGRVSTLFDELIIESISICPRVSSGMLVFSGDVLLLFNPLQIDYYGTDAAVFSFKEDVETGSHHGVYIKNQDGFVESFLHKQTPEKLRSLGATDKNDRINIDTGAAFFSTPIINDLWQLVADEKGFERYINERVRLSFYGDFIYPMAAASTEEQFKTEAPEGEMCDELLEARRVLWDILHKYRIKMLSLSPASFIHFGTTSELLKLMTADIDTYSYLGWSRAVSSNVCCKNYTAYNSYIEDGAEIGDGTFIENSIIDCDCTVAEGCVISCMHLSGVKVAAGTVLHGLKLKSGRFTVRMYGVNDNPKLCRHFGSEIDELLWTSKRFPVCDTVEEVLECLFNGKKADEYTSLCESFNNADTRAISEWERRLVSKVDFENFLSAIRMKYSLDDRFFAYGKKPADKTVEKLIEYADGIECNTVERFSEKIRIYYYLDRLTDKKLMDECYGAISSTILEKSAEAFEEKDVHIAADEVNVSLPVRINFGGGWSDTPPVCMEQGGTVFNVAIKLDGGYPVSARIKKTDTKTVILSSADNNSYEEFTDMRKLSKCGDPSDSFALHKAALRACGIVKENDNRTVEELTEQIGGGFSICTDVVNIPRGSGLGTSSILSAACVKAIFEFFGMTLTDSECSSKVFDIEQIMSTGGGWQDQAGAISDGFKMVTSKAGLHQEIKIDKINLEKDFVKKLEDRLCLVYTGQRRLARNLLRDIIGKYIASDRGLTEAIREIQNVAVLMRFELERENIYGFATLMNRHWELSQIIDSGCTNTCIDQIFLSIDDLIDGKMICGAGGGGFLQVVLKEGTTKEELDRRLESVFADAGPRVWNYSFDI